MELDTVAKITDTFYRLVGTEDGDTALTEHGEAADEVAQLCLTHGCRQGQRWMLKCGYGGWRQRSSALTFSGADATDGGKYVALPSDFLQAYGNQHLQRSALVEANGDRWGREIEADEDHMTGDLYYIRGDQLWLARQAAPPTTLYLDYHYKHPAWDDDLDDGEIDFPLEARILIPAEAAAYGMTQNWLPGDREYERKIATARLEAREAARLISRRTKQPRTMLKPKRFMSRY